MSQVPHSREAGRGDRVCSPPLGMALILPPVVKQELESAVSCGWWVSAALAPEFSLPWTLNRKITALLKLIEKRKVRPVPSPSLPAVCERHHQPRR